VDATVEKCTQDGGCGGDEGRPVPRQQPRQSHQLAVAVEHPRRPLPAAVPLKLHHHHYH
ncbi:hypothetical protein BHM03_00055312, partial [Ensete ventricosum]